MDQDRHRRVKVMFEAASRRSGAAREAYLAQVCGDDPSLRAEIEALLASAAESGAFLNATDGGPSAVLRQALAGMPPSPPEGAGLVGRQIGRYRVVRLIASGGMGAVYEAEQESPRRTVALKVMRRGIASRSALRRFEYESQILARLRHPGIAQIYEAGMHREDSDEAGKPQSGGDGKGSRTALQATAEGTPWFAMEYIPHALPINEFARMKGLSVRQRLMLFGKVCDAVHHGHQKGIVHRDLKPSIILVDADGNPRIIDFGIARATDADVAITTFQTDVGQILGTLQYMSPEQCAADPHDLDVRSDVYALGVVLYELLCERLPYNLSGVAVYEAARLIREVAPARPSTLNRTLRGDVETIALKALEKDRERRYQSAAELGQDIWRYLRGEAIVARPPSVAYQFRTFARRHKAVFGSMAAVIAVLSVAVVAVSMLALQLRAERDRAEREAARALAAEAQSESRAMELEQVAEFQAAQLGEIDVAQMGTRLRADLIARAAAFRAADGNESVQQEAAELEEMLRGVNFTDLVLKSLDENILDATYFAIQATFDDQPLVKARLLQSLGRTMWRLGLYEPARLPLGEALAILREHQGHEHHATLRALDYLGRLMFDLGWFDKAERYWGEALELAQGWLGPEDSDTARQLSHMGLVMSAQGRYAEAEALYQSALESMRRLKGDHDPDTLTILSDVGLVNQYLGRNQQAEAHLREVLEARLALLGREHPDTIGSLNNLGVLLMETGRAAEAEGYLVDALEACRGMLGSAHANTLLAVQNVAFVLHAQGKVDEAEPYYVEAIEGYRQVLGEGHPRLLAAMSNYGKLLRTTGRIEEAEAVGASAVAVAKESLPRGHWHIAALLYQHGTTLVAMERFQEAEAQLLEAYAIVAEALGDDHSRTRAAAGALVSLYDAWHDAEPGGGHDAAAEKWRERQRQ